MLTSLILACALQQSPDLRICTCHPSTPFTVESHVEVRRYDRVLLQVYTPDPRDVYAVWGMYADPAATLLLGTWEHQIGHRPYTWVRPRPEIPATTMIGTKVYIQAWAWPAGGPSNVVEVEVVL